MKRSAVRCVSAGMARGFRRRGAISIRKRSVHVSVQRSRKADPPRSDIDFDSLAFALTPVDTMYVSETKKGEAFPKGKLLPYGPLPIYPSATALNYGQGLFEGLKAFRTSKGRVSIFRPDQNFIRINEGAANFLMPNIPEDVWFNALNSIVDSNCSYVPPENKGALYLRPCVFGSGPALGVAPSPSYHFTIYASPVGNYFPGGKLTGIKLRVSQNHHRAAARGSGHIKAIGNYAPCFAEQARAKKDGYHEVLFVDSKTENFIEEAGAANVFCLTRDGVLKTPKLGSILPGVTRRSVMELATRKGVKVEEGNVSLLDFFHAKEAFAAGTGASITPIESVTHGDVTHDFGGIGEFTQDMYNTILDIQFERNIPEGLESWLYYPLEQK
eukprot:TRINITY_DN10020_c0_g1_i2.p1 TRINITY_DN10020_c0_g1~~TRINITY_DN10020_c0_g1_i2.p1  ORF type:complete len:385 (+),score=49.44 TRINITY_DN10020_c0_g1_i2:88-1242(+)